MIVMKFGGTSVGDGAAMLRLADIVASRRDRNPVVVVSAMSGTTDTLLKAAHAAGEGDLHGALSIARALRERHEAAIAHAVTRPQPRAQVEEVVGAHFAGLELMLEALALLRETGPKANDAVSSHGELLSAEIVARVLESRDLPGSFFDVRHIMITDDTFGRAAPVRAALAERSNAHLAPVVQAGRIPVTQGFVGSTTRGTPTTLGRGGSDYTAALIGAALRVEEVEIWTDVDGLMTADPRVIKSARSLPEASYDEAAELAFFGAKVLHPATILPLVELDIPVWIKNSNRAQVEGTRVTATTPRAAHTVKSIAWKRGVTILNLRAPRMLGAHGFLKSMFDIFEDHGVAVDVVTTSEVSVSVSLENGAALDELTKDLGTLGEVTVTRDRAIVCVVGEGLRETAGIPARIFKALATVPIEMISQGASKINLTFVIADTNAVEAVTSLHREFFESH